MTAPFPRTSICGIPVDDVTVERFIQVVSEWSERGNPQRVICYLNAHVHNLARRDAALRGILNETALCYADGASIVWAARLFGLPIAKRMTAADFLPDVMRRLHQEGRRVYFLGGKPGIAQKTASVLGEEIPGFEPAEISHGYFDDAESNQVVAKINESESDLVIVGMGTPRQEAWIAKHRNELNAPLIWAVGALFDYRAGEENRCPKWMGDNGLEWLYRLAMNPKRMASRYLLGNPQFVVSVLRSRLFGSGGKQPAV